MQIMYSSPMSAIPLPTAIPSMLTTTAMLTASINRGRALRHIQQVPHLLPIPLTTVRIRFICSVFRRVPTASTARSSSPTVSQTVRSRLQRRLTSWQERIMYSVNLRKRPAQHLQTLLTVRSQAMSTALPRRTRQTAEPTFTAQPVPTSTSTSLTTVRRT